MDILHSPYPYHLEPPQRKFIGPKMQMHFANHASPDQLIAPNRIPSNDPKPFPLFPHTAPAHLPQILAPCRKTWIVGWEEYDHAGMGNLGELRGTRLKWWDVDLFWHVNFGRGVDVVWLFDYITCQAGQLEDDVHGTESNGWESLDLI
ncbi:hypothetical protein PDE_00957 [Penicillium oxalicum 114-2]|uniref:Uncharacterized protein n=1 Tax=Penicillium oxalicum (strain 114-2 / CGMCC 5302) TaxID=933388 RepID=S7ZBF8_PENO1|nr:hypothetical protein PDE_00957 [Penicillium oxalicum 114-2]